MMTIENEVVMALSQKVAQLERRLDTIAKLHLSLAEKYEELTKKHDSLSLEVAQLDPNND